jgi:hypothetical protein
MIHVNVKGLDTRLAETIIFIVVVAVQIGLLASFKELVLTSLEVSFGTGYTFEQIGRPCAVPILSLVLDQEPGVLEHRPDREIRTGRPKCSCVTRQARLRR